MTKRIKSAIITHRTQLPEHLGEFEMVHQIDISAGGGIEGSCSLYLSIE